MSSTVNYDELYEEFVRMTASPSKELPDQPYFVTIKDEDEESLLNSPLNALTPPSPLNPLPTPLQAFSGQQQNLYQPFNFPPSYVNSSEQMPSDFSNYNYNMCDNSVSASPSIVVATPGSSTQGKYMGGESNISTTSSNHVSVPSYLNSLLPHNTQQQQPLGNGNLANPHSLYGHNMTMEGNHSQLSHQQQLHPPLAAPHSHHHMPYNNHVHQHFMENQHHQQQQHNMNLPQQHNGHGHQLNHSLPPLPSSHPGPHPAHSHSQQQLMPFGGVHEVHVHLNPNNVGNGNQFANPHQHLGHFHSHHHQIPNQQPAHTMAPPMQQHSCFMQHAACVQMQHQHHQSLTALNTQRGGVGWMGVPPPISIGNSVGNTGNSCGPGHGLAGLSAKLAPPSVPNPVIPDPTALPGGLEHLWREAPQLQRFMVPQDIPDSARFRGYFTVCELLGLKRMLEVRQGCGEIAASSLLSTPPIGTKVLGKEEGRRSKKGNKNDTLSKGSVNFIASVEKFIEEKNCEVQAQIANEGKPMTSLQDTDGDSHMHDAEGNSQDGGEQLINLDNLKHEIHTDIPPAVTGVCVGGAVKEAMEALTSDQMQNNNSGNVSNMITDENNMEEHDKQDDMYVAAIISNDLALETGDKINDYVESPATASDIGTFGIQDDDVCASASNNQPEDIHHEEVIPVDPAAIALPCMGDKDCSSPKEDLLSPENSIMTIDLEGTKVEIQEEEGRQECQVAATPIFSGDQMAVAVASPSMLSTVHINTAVPNPNIGCCVPAETRFSGVPYRTAMLAIKLLQIGACKFRSFSINNPNRLRVLFNTQRMTYECQLPIVHSNNPTSPNVLRKVLTIDIGFDQVSMIKFSPDSLYMRVEGPPLLTVSYNPAQEEPIQPISPQDQLLLDQIDKGQLKLSPCHQMYFLNLRKVQALEKQFRDHPRFQHFFMSRK